ncbi:uncharacterized protein BX664DRAFT_330718 [Halteromyces radiatus]|uniref:uncharacterized protein n=1 Tax=Halteromyces radiatus TaxID=101107 RepID=UPI00221E3B99|nr:uncharacterized protein BX664DRAFT_330718 [Halteromyces radiatus]KAI8093841.1 hypothetical protein BX664DRAFT_330718 [Halteromyces radiatus]
MSATPDSKMRKHLAQKLQMPERSIQIWFQNRRAKVKMLQRRALLREEQEVARAKLYAEAASQQHHTTTHSPYWYGPTSLSGFPPPPPPPPSSIFPPQTKLPIQRAWSTDPTRSSFIRPYHSIYNNNNNNNISGEMKESFYHMSPSPTPHPMVDLENDTFKSFQDTPTTFIENNLTPSDVTTGIINANAVTIGTWHRMKMNQQDLLCCFQLSERTFEWHIRDSNYHFKMVISFDLVQSLDITLLDNGIFAQMDMELTEPPLFFMENMDDLTWIQCSDFTEGMQATCHLHHTLRGLASDLRQELLGMISMDQHLCQVIRFPMTDLSTTTLQQDISSLDPSSLMSWRHQSLPLNMKDFEWSSSSF